MTRQKLTLPEPPSVLKAIRAGFDTITRHLILLLFPVGLDLFLWFGPRLRIKQQIESLVAEFSALYAANSHELGEMLTAGEDFWMAAAERLNILVALRSYPVGVFSLLSSIYPLKHPLGSPVFVEIPSIWTALLLTLVMVVLGICLGAFYFSAVSQAVLHDQLHWGKVFKKWPRNMFQSLFLSGIWLGLFLVVAVLGSCLISGLTLIGPALGQMALFVLGVMYTWMLFPLFFSPHGIFSGRLNAWKSVVESIKLTNLTFMKTGLFILFAVLVTQGLSMIWQTPPEDSWLLMVSILGHSFVSTGVLAASFVYYQKIVYWVEEIQTIQEITFSGEDVT